MILEKDCENQLQAIFKIINTDSVINYKNSEIKKCFSYIYIINFLTKRIELKHLFNTKAYIVSYSCLIESFILLLENYPRGSSLVLRSALENFIKCVIKISGEGNYTINDRSYGENRKTLDNIIDSEIIPDKYKQLFKTVNAQMHSTYGKLSGLSHSLTPESQNNLLKYFSDSDFLNTRNIDIVLNHAVSVLEYIFTCSLIISRNSLEKWNRSDLKEIFSYVYGKKRTEKMLILFS